jgi:hypothetical protein
MKHRPVASGDETRGLSGRGKRGSRVWSYVNARHLLL